MGVPTHIDPRRRRTRDVLVSAFVSLARQQRYDDIRIDDILAAAGVSRSTFYEHFSGKRALLAASMSGTMLMLARLPFGQSSHQQVAALLEHLWQTRMLARGLLRGTALAAVRAGLVGHIESSFDIEQQAALQLPRRLAAHALADGMLSPILAWLSGEAECDAGMLATSLSRSSMATLAGMVEVSDANR